MDVEISLEGKFTEEEIVNLYTANGWSSANKPKELMAALKNSHGLAIARIAGQLVGLGNAISDGFLVVYYPHLLVHPDYHGRGIGRKLLQALQRKYSNIHQQMLVADGQAVDFYRSVGFVRAGDTVPMWIYEGDDH